jgi:hypothetical protein
MSDTPTGLPAAMADVERYMAIRQQQRADSVNAAMNTLTPFERRIVREAAVMGYVQGAMAGRSRATLDKPQDGDIPSDADMLFEVVSACIHMSDLYPYLAAASTGKRRRVTRKRLWPGERIARSRPACSGCGRAGGELSENGCPSCDRPEPS